MYKCINGWTKARMLAVIEARPFTERAWNEDTRACTYRTVDGNKCAVGLFIPENLPNSNDMFSLLGPVSELLRGHPVLREYLPLNTCGMDKLQMIHDGSKGQNAKHNMLKWIRETVSE